jgi:hypothetical protein
VSLVKYNNNSISAVTSAASIPSGALTHIKTLTASSSSTLSFVDGSNGVTLDSTYPIYVFKFINCHPSGNVDYLSVNFSIDGGSNYNVAKTSTAFRAYHTENNSAASLDYLIDYDLAQGTGLQYLTGSLGNANDESVSGTLNLFNPSSTTFVKHYIYRGEHSFNDDGNIDFFVSGYGNTTSAINAVKFQMSSGNIDSGKIKLYGIKDS